MGSEHYCLRWNNHQNNLLGVFSQLLQDESLVDVTLACAEGHSIRAHKVVLSACSSYFRSLFVEHPGRHPIVILKDVRFAELRTLVEFMYKGEVNVEYCQLSALLATAESLKVKGLTDMTNVTPVREVSGEGQKISVLSEIRRTPETKRPAEEEIDMSETVTRAPSPKRPTLIQRNSPHTVENNNNNSCDEGGTDHHSPEIETVTPPPPPPPISDEMPEPSDLSMPSSCIPTSTIMTATCSSSSGSRLPSPHNSEPIPGPSNMLPVQQVPLSLKKEVDWDRNTTDEKSTIGESSSDYRHPHDPDSNGADEKYGTSCDVLPSSSSLSSSRYRGNMLNNISRSSTPFQFPFPIFGTNFTPNYLGDANNIISQQNSILNLLQQQALITSTMDDGRNSLGSVTGSLFRCPICFAAFPSGWLLEQHTNLQHSLPSVPDDGEPVEEKPFKCEQCGQSYRYRSAYLKHREQNHRARLPADKLFTCDVCGMQFRYLKSFKKHRLNHALEKLHCKPSRDSDLLGRSARNNGMFSNPFFGRMGFRGGSSTYANSATSYSAKMLMLMQNASRSNGDIFSLGMFGMRDNRRMTTAAPSSTVSSNDGSDQVSSSNEAVGNISDPSINMDGSSNATLSPDQGMFKFSIDDYFGNSVTTIPETGSTSTDKGSDSKSLDTEQDETIDSLAVALSVTASSTSAIDVFRSAQEASLFNLLRLEAMERQRERRFACPFCGKCVRSKENLKLHVRKHTGERPFVCLFCGRAFGGKSDLTRHLRIHTGERPYHCEMCGKCFARADYLSKHLTTHIHNSQR